MTNQFRKDVEALMAKVPAGRVATYGDLAALAGQPYAARVCGGMAHYGDPELPWHRLVNRFGGLAAGYHGGRRTQELDDCGNMGPETGRTLGKWCARASIGKSDFGWRILRLYAGKSLPRRCT